MPNSKPMETIKGDFSDIANGWDRLLGDMGYADVVGLETSIGVVTFRITKVGDDGYFAVIDDEMSRLNERYTHLRDAIEELAPDHSHDIYLFIERKSGKMSLRLGKLKAKSE